MKTIQMKALYLIFHGFEPFNGISKKIGYQKKAMEQCGVNTQLCFLDIDNQGDNKRMIDNKILDNYGKGFFAKIKKRIKYSGLYKYIINNNFDFIYIRSYHNASPFMIRFVKKLKNYGIKVIMEIPTFPYDQEYKMLSRQDHLRLFIDKIYRNKLAKYLYKIVTFSDDDKIFGASTIKISNGIDFDQIKIKSSRKKDPHSINLLGVAEIHFWHGFDRLIKGLANYYKTKQKIEVIFNIVGYGAPEEIKILKDLITKNHLESNVHLLGSKSGKELDDQFEKADFGIASLARHRSGIKSMKSLKNREYAARGIPFIYSEIDENFEKMPYIIKAPADDTPINIENIVNFYYSHSFDPSEIRNSIFPDLSWKEQMQKVVNNIIHKE